MQPPDVRASFSSHPLTLLDLPPELLEIVIKLVLTTPCARWSERDLQDALAQDEARVEAGRTEEARLKAVKPGCPSRHRRHISKYHRQRFFMCQREPIPRNSTPLLLACKRLSVQTATVIRRLCSSHEDAAGRAQRPSKPRPSYAVELLVVSSFQLAIAWTMVPVLAENIDTVTITLRHAGGTTTGNSLNDQSATNRVPLAKPISFSVIRDLLGQFLVVLLRLGPCRKPGDKLPRRPGINIRCVVIDLSLPTNNSHVEGEDMRQRSLTIGQERGEHGSQASEQLYTIPANAARNYIDKLSRLHRDLLEAFKQPFSAHPRQLNRFDQSKRLLYERVESLELQFGGEMRERLDLGTMLDIRALRPSSQRRAWAMDYAIIEQARLSFGFSLPLRPETQHDDSQVTRPDPHLHGLPNFNSSAYGQDSAPADGDSQSRLASTSASL